MITIGRKVCLKRDGLAASGICWLISHRAAYPRRDGTGFMHGIAYYLLEHGYLVLFAFVLAEQIGTPIPSFPVLLAMGALAHRGRYSFFASIGLASLACLLCDLGWYHLGRFRGHKILNFLCRISLEPDSCVRRTEESFERHGARSLLFAKFVPGLATAAPSLAGLLRMRISSFAVWDVSGATAWAAAFVGAGYIFSAQLERASAVALGLGSVLGVLVVGALAAYLAWKYLQRQRFIRSLRIARITPEELRQKMDSGEEIVIVDLRHSSEFEADDATLPGALRLRPEQFEQNHKQIPRDRDVVLYCSCPNEATSARVALLLRGKGITRVRPLAGGFEAWHSLGYPVERQPVAAGAEKASPSPSGGEGGAGAANP